MWRTGWMKMAGAVSGAAEFFAGAQARAIALRLALCFVLGAALGGQARAEGMFSGPGLGFPPDIPCKKNEIPYFDYLGFRQISLADWAADDARSAVVNKYFGSKNATDIICWQLPMGGMGEYFWLKLYFRVDDYLYELPPLERAVAWHGLCNVLEPLARGYEAAVRQTRELVEVVARQRLRNPPAAGSSEFSGEELQNLADHYRNLEQAFAAVAQKLRADQARNLTRLPQDIRQALGRLSLAGPELASSVGIPASEAAFLAQVRQRRLAMFEAMDEIMYQVGMAFDSDSMMSVRIDSNRDDRVDLFLAETFAHAAVAQLAVDRNLPDKLGLIIDAAIKDAASLYLGEILESFDFKVEAAENPRLEIRQYKEYLPYYRRDVEVIHQARGLVWEIKEYMAQQGGQ